MKKYYTRACNFFYGKTSRNLVFKKLSLPLSGNNNISFDTIEIISRKSIDKIKVKDLNKISKKQRQQIYLDIKNLVKKKKNKKFKVQ